MRRIVIDQLVFVPRCCVPLAIASVFPHLFLAFTIFKTSLAIESHRHCFVADEKFYAPTGGFHLILQSPRFTD